MCGEGVWGCKVRPDRKEVFYLDTISLFLVNCMILG